MENSQPTFNPAANPQSQNTTKSAKTANIVAITTSILAVIGISFGAYGMIQNSSKTQQISDLNAKIEQIANTNTNTSTSTSPDDSQSPSTSEDTSNIASQDATSQYIYIGEWGIKIKLDPTLVNNISYLFSGNDLTIIDKNGVYFGPTESEIVGETNAEMRIIRKPKGEVDFVNCLTSCPTYITTIDDYDYMSTLTGNNIEVLDSTPLRTLNEAENYSNL